MHKNTLIYKESVYNNLFKRNKIIRYIFFSLFSVLYVDYFSQNFIGAIITLGLTLYLIVFGIKDLYKSFKYFLILFVILPPLPRNILDTYEAVQVTKTISYYVLTGMQIGGVSIIQWLTLFYIIMFTIRIFKEYGHTIKNKYYKILSFLLLFPIVITIAFAIFEPKYFIFREVITGMRFPLYLILGVLFCIRYSRKPQNVITVYIIEILIAISVIIGARVPVFLILSQFESIPSLDLGVIPHIPFAVLFSMLMLKHKNKRMIIIIITCLFGLLAPSRGQIFTFLIIMLQYLWLSKFNYKQVKNVMIIAVVIIGIFGLVSIYNTRLYDFFLWKFEDFSLSNEDGISPSGLVRVYEFLNISNLLFDNPIKFIFGSGLSGYFTYDSYPFPFPDLLDLKSYQEFELKSGIYYHPHFFINTILLKFGLIGLIIYVTAIIQYYKLCIKGFRKCIGYNSFIYSFGIFFSLSLLLEMQFRGYYAILFPILYFNSYYKYKSLNKIQ